MQTQQQEELKMEWEVETEHAAVPEIEVEVETEQADSNIYNNTYNRDVRVARAYNKHIFTWVFNFLLGMFGLDRFMRGQTGLGLLKLISFGGFGYWYLIDYFIAIVKTYSGPYKNMSEFLFDKNGHYIN